MRQKSSTRLTGFQKLVILLILISLSAVYEYFILSGKLNKISVYDELSDRLNSVKTRVARLEYLLDMYVVASRFENTTVEMIKDDVSEIDKDINERLSGPGFRKLLAQDAMLYDGISSIADDWRVITGEINRLNSASSKDEVILIHNAVDTNTVLVNERATTLLKVTFDNRNAVFSEIKSHVIGSLAVFLAFAVLLAALYRSRVHSLMQRLISTAGSVAGGARTGRFSESGGFAYPLGSALNDMLDSFEGMLDEKDKILAGKVAQLESMGNRMKAVSTFLSFAGSSISTDALFTALLTELARSRSIAAAVYLIDENEMRLKSSVGFPEEYAREASAVWKGAPGDESLRSGKSRIFERMEDYPDHAYASLLARAGFNVLFIAPMSYDGVVTGLLYLAFKERIAVSDEARLFFETLSGAAAVVAGHISLFQREFERKRFYERILNQLPQGAAVFDRDGYCRFFNERAKKLMGADAGAGFADVYRLLDDDALAASGALDELKKAYDGAASETVVDYDPALLAKYGFKGKARRLRINGLPLFDPSGDIREILVVYDVAD
ncbi:MAG: GAF domain-containing protein [Deltaproteobacteria bacterium]|nr:GAF domain-containing protein [Deltaproteobacteria bacterium]